MKLTLTTTSRGRAAIAARVLLSFYTQCRLPSVSEVTLHLAYGDAKLGGTGSALGVGRRRFHFGMANPAGLVRMAVLGRGLFKEKIPLRAIGLFPSWDRLVFAVRSNLGISSLADLETSRYPLRVSTRVGAASHTTLFAIHEVLKAYGFGFADIEAWGGRVLRVSHPGSAERKRHIRSGEVDAVFDEGIKNWGSLALESGFDFLPLPDATLRKMARLGFSGAVLSQAHFSGLKSSIPTLDFSGWPLFCHGELAPEVTGKMAEAVDLVHREIPVDHLGGGPMDMLEFCRGGDAGPLTIPLHRGARRYFERKGYL